MEVAILAALVFFACKSDDADLSNSAEKSNTNATAGTSIHNQQFHLMGAWAAPGEHNATFTIIEDSIYYTDLFLSYPYQLRNDTLTIEYEDSKEDFRITMIGNDTLILVNSDEQVFYRFKD